MRVPSERDSKAHERHIRALSDQSGADLGEVRVLFREELARLGMGAKVGSYLAVLTTSNVRGMLRRKSRLADAARSARRRNSEHVPSEP